MGETPEELADWFAACTLAASLNTSEQIADWIVAVFREQNLSDEELCRLITAAIVEARYVSHRTFTRAQSDLPG